MFVNLPFSRDLSSIGHLASQFRVPVRRVERVAVELDVVPAMRLNGVIYFDGQQTEQLADRLQETTPQANEAKQ